MADPYGTETKTPSIPDVRSTNTLEVLQAVKEWIEIREGDRGAGLDRAVTLRDLLNTGLATPDMVSGVTGSQPSASAPGLAQPDVPPTPDGLTTAGSISTIMLAWTFARGYSRLANFEVWRSETNALGDAVLIATPYASPYPDEVGAEAEYYYWVRAVSDAGKSPFNAVAGTVGKTVMSPDEVVTLVNDQIDTSGLLDQLTIKVDEGGNAVGWGPASVPSTDTSTGTSLFAVLAERFIVAPPPTLTGVDSAPLFTIQTVPTVVNGEAVAKGVYFTDAWFMNGTFTGAKMANATITDAKIASLSVAKLLAGALAVGQYIESSNFVSGVSGFRIHADGSAEFSDGTFRGAVYSSAGYIGGAQITADYIQSSNYNGTDAGFRLNKSGAVSFTNGTFRGTVYALAGTFSGSLQAATGTFSGSLNAATGTFRGGVMGGAYTGYAWPTPGQYGFYLGPSGLLLGNANNNRYVQITATGDIYTPAFSVVGGVMTVNQANVINTVNIAGEAVTVPRGASADWGSVPFGTGRTFNYGDTILTLPTIDPGSAPVIIWATAMGYLADPYGQYTLFIDVYRNGTMVKTFPASPLGVGSDMFIDYPFAAVTYSLRISYYNGSGDTPLMNKCSLVAMACKR